MSEIYFEYESILKNHSWNFRGFTACINARMQESYNLTFAKIIDQGTVCRIMVYAFLSSDFFLN